VGEGAGGSGGKRLAYFGGGFSCGGPKCALAHIIGIKQAGNIVGNITGGGEPWSASGGRARVDLATGNMEFEVHGLILAGGNSIGTPGAITQVLGTLVCAASSATPVTMSSPSVPLSLG
jgi:hypothetical protein